MNDPENHLSGRIIVKGMRDMRLDIIQEQFTVRSRLREDSFLNPEDSDSEESEIDMEDNDGKPRPPPRRRRSTLVRLDSFDTLGANRPSLTLSKIQQLDIIEAMDLCDELSISYDGLDDIEEFKERLRLHRFKLKAGSPRTGVERSINKIGREDEQKRAKLLTMIEQLKNAIHGRCGGFQDRSSLMVENLLKDEGTMDNIEEDCSKRAAVIRGGECVLLVAGETSAGKSSVLNLLFGEEILPVHIKSSTSVITVIRYNKKRYAKIINKNGADIEFDLDEEGMKRFQSIAFMQSQAEREHHNIKEVQVYLPLNLLKSGLVLVDTPGVGENEFLEQELMHFISNNQILGFVYIIKTDAAGGVQEDRLLNLLKLVLNKHKKGDKGMIKFDPRAAIFVCNRYDLIKDDERPKIIKNAMDKLASCWPQFDKSQVLFFSTSKAQRDVDADPDYINDNFKELLERLRNLYVTALERRVKSSYKWIEQVLRRTVHHLKSVVRRLDMSDKDLRDKSQSTRVKLLRLKTESEKVITRARMNIEVVNQEICQNIRKHLQQQKIQARLTGFWTSRDLPDPDQGLGDWEWIKGRIDQVFYDRLGCLIEEWDDENKTITNLNDEVTNGIQMGLELLEKEMDEIEREIQCDTDSVDSDYSALRTSRRFSVLPSPNKIKFSSSEPMLPIRLASRLFKPITKIVVNRRQSEKRNDFLKDPVKCARKRAEKVFKSLFAEEEDENALKPFVQQLLEHPTEYVNTVEEKIPGMIQSNERILSHLEQSIKEEKEYQKEYEEMMKNIESLKKDVGEYGEGYIFVNDFMKGEIQMKQATDDGNNISVPFSVSDLLSSSSTEQDVARGKEIHGLWSIIFPGFLCREECEVPISVRVYLPSSGVVQTFEEVAKLRCLSYRGSHLAEFLGIHHVDAPAPAFVYNGMLRSMRRFMASSFCLRQVDVPRILLEVASGLNYLHSKGFVHMELTQDTITLDEEGYVSLSGICLPRKAALPLDKESVDTGHFVYVPPEVLRGGLYLTCADIYSFGLLLVECLVPTVENYVLKRERKFKMYQFIQDVDPLVMLSKDTSLDSVSESMKNLIQWCIQVDDAKRPTIEVVLEVLPTVKNEKVLASFPNIRSKAPVMKRHSSKDLFRTQ